MVEGARLESVYTPKGYPGFESLTLRFYLGMYTRWENLSDIVMELLYN